ncbi:MAG TPA: LamG domain-containing protein, partial [Candidatus Limnocylindria bacterium]|nr:LamG domain-containing protein [Candidatus Limnocylindria bacterium]
SWVTDNGSGGWARIFDFGNSVGGEDQGTGGTQYVFLSLPAGDGFLRGAYTLAGGGAPEQIVEWLGGRPDVGTQAHIVWTSDAISHTGKIFVNGSQVAINTNVTITPADLGHTVNDWLGRSQYPDPFFNGSFNEFRIYDSALSPLQIAIDGAAGPDKVVTDPGAISALSLTVTGSMNVGTIQRASVVADFANVTGVNVAGSATYTTDKPTVISIDADGTVHGVGPGTAKLTASYGGLSKDATITVIAKPSVLTHRYSFTADANDSIGTANGATIGSASVSGGKLVLDGNGAVTLPAGIIDNTYDALTIEAWAHVAVTVDGTPTHLFGFGDGLTKFVRLRTHSAGNNSILGLSGGTEATAAQSGPIAGNVHIVSVFNPQAGYIEFYVNGQVANTNVVTQLLSAISGTNDLFNVIGAHHDSTTPMTGEIDEFRIYNGALSRAQIRASYAAGPANLGFNPGTVQSVSVSLLGHFLNGTIQRPIVHATSATVSNFDVTALDGVTFSSGNTGVVQVLADGRVQATGVGTTTLTATYQGVSGSTSVTVTPAQLTLKHRYSFTTDATDSISGANGSLHGDATVSSGALNLPNDPAVGRGSYLDLPPELLGGYKALTVEAWVSLDANNVWARIADFGDYNTGGGGHTYFFLCPHTGGNTIRIAVNDGTGEDVFDNGAAGLDSAGPTHIVAVVDPQDTQTGSVYVNGALLGTSTFTKPLSTIIDAHNFVGRSVYTGDGFLNGTINEFRIYYGALNASQVAANFAAGPDVIVPIVNDTPPTLSIALSGVNVVLSWPDASTGFVLESSGVLGSGWAAVATAPDHADGKFSVTLPIGATSNTFFRLRK